jgi:hypothetical protein
VENIFGVLFSLYRGTSRHGEMVVACLEGAWTKLLGNRLAAACRPARFEGSTLIIEVIDLEWEEAIKDIRPDLLDKLRSATAGEISRIVVSRRSTV